METTPAPELLAKPLGPEVTAIQALMVANVLEAYERSRDARQAGGLKTNHAYGSNLWPAHGNAVTSAILTHPDATSRQVTGYAFSFAVVKRVLFFPILMKPNGSGTPQLDASPGSFKRAAFSLQPSPSSPHQLPLFDSSTASYSIHSEILDGIDQVVVIVSSIAPETGLMAMHVGEMTMVAGSPAWVTCQQIQVPRYKTAPLLGVVDGIDDTNFRAEPDFSPALQPRKQKASDRKDNDPNPN